VSFVTPESDDPRDPLGLAGDAPLLAGWLRFSAAVGAGAVVPFTIPGHKQRTDLVGEVVRGDVPLYGGLDTPRPRPGVRVLRARRISQVVAGSVPQALLQDVHRPGDHEDSDDY